VGLYLHSATCIHAKYRGKLIFTLFDRERERDENAHFVFKLIFLIFTVSLLKA
jgi:hypothetical protein